MSHPNEDRLRHLYAAFAEGNLQGFLDGCTDDVTFTVPGNTPGSGTFTKETFLDWIGTIMAVANGTFREDVLDVFANDEHGVLLLHHSFERDGRQRAYATAHVVRFRGDLVAEWEERPGSLTEFEEAWGRRQ
jgi:ketosteroid isomerase-like protein